MRLIAGVENTEVFAHPIEHYLRLPPTTMLRGTYFANLQKGRSLFSSESGG
jgi:hypothetical protein